MTLRDFAAIYLDRLYDPRITDENQCSGWYHLKKLVEDKVKIEDLTDDMLCPFHPLLRTWLKQNWYRIYGLQV